MVSYSISPLTSKTHSDNPISHTSPWDVFLSFRGPDTRNKFTNHLYNVLDLHGLRTFMDRPELRTGEAISESLIQAIHDSKTYVVVFSEDYATSTWCLDELLEIYKCYKTMKKLVIGVYYHVNPSDVRHQNESFEKAFQKHETGRYASQMGKVKEWRDALKFVTGFSGQTISPQSDEVDVINEIAEVIQLHVKPKTLYVADYPVGLDSHVEHISTWFSSDTEEGVFKIGIYGMGGVGKTTLAKALYNKLLKRNFKASSFLAEVREAFQKANEVVTLQKQLINDVLRSKTKVYNVAQGTKFIKENLDRRVLVVMDDIDEFEQYQSLVGPFASGSVVIITTRNEDILDKIEVEPKHRFNVKELDDAESVALFTQHATEKFLSDINLMKLSKDILSLAGGLPLALKIFGSYLSTQSEVGWKAYIRKLQLNPNSTIQQKFLISLDAIELADPMLKDIFLDIACFFIGRKKEEVLNIMDTHYSDVEHYIDILKKRCLLTISITHELRMHDLLRDIGEKLAHNKHPTEAGKHSRLWISKDICDVLKRQKGTEAIECVIPRNFHYHDALEGVSFATETYKKMSKLRFLYLKSVDLRGSFEQIFEDLKWLRWDCCPWNCLPSDFCLEKLVVLVLRCSNMKTMWKPNWGFQMLTTLDMSYSLYLTTSPDFTELPSLETLDLEGCESLMEVHTSIGSLKNLAFLDLGYCTKLTSLPDSICSLTALKTLIIGSCNSLEALPTDLGNINSLTELHASKLTVLNVPDSIGNLSNLVKLILSYNKKLQTLPDTICYLSALKVLDIGGCSSLEALPLELGNIKSLTELNAWGLNVSEFADSIKRLSKFVQLNLSQNQYHETSHSTRWDVFLSFSGIDTQNKFSGQLYSALLQGGIRTYMDDSELSSGEAVSDALFQPIQKSKTYIVVFSKNYASSPLCLEKIVQIINCHKSIRRLVIPVFYNIDKSVVLHQTESFREAFELHQLRFGIEKVDNWRLKLTQVADFPGYHIAESWENDVIKEIVDEILLQKSPKALNVAKFTVGLNSHVKNIRTMMSSHTEGVIKIGIYGMVGVGKTTLAQALYNELLEDSFDNSCFLAGICEVVEEKGLTYMQQQLLDGILTGNGKEIIVHHVKQGYKLIQDKICSEKVLVVLDDLNHPDQFEYLVGPFAPGSVVIITTRDQDLLDRINVKPRYQYMMTGLDDTESLALFNHHAFRKTSPKKSLEDLSNQIVGFSGGLPLALRVFAGALRGRYSEDYWISYIDKVQIMCENYIHPILIISFDELALVDPKLQDLFLDISCFFIGCKKEEVVKIMGTCYLDTSYYISILKRRCMLAINNRDELEMHILFKDMGRKIACNTPGKEPGTRSRVWDSKDIYTVLAKRKGIEVIEGIVQHDELEQVPFTAETSLNMPNLRFLYLKNVKLIGNSKITVRNLRWLHWDNFPLEFLPSELCPIEIAVLELPHSRMRMLWELNMPSQVFVHLTTLNMMYSKDLIRTPDFISLPYLETLNLEGCESLEEIHVSIGSLVRLVSVNLRGCSKLRAVPNTTGRLRELQVLIVGDCNSMEELPTQLGNIISLQVLIANALDVSKLPDSIGNLHMLVKLELSYNKKLETLPNTICYLGSLEVLNINGCSGLKELPTNLGLLRSLKELNASALTVTELPDSVGYLSKLVQLKLRYNEKLETLPESICNLTSLQNLDIGYCRHLLSIAYLPLDLKCIRADGCTSMKSLPELSNLELLEYVYSPYCCGLTEILYKSESCTGIIAWKNSLL